MHRQHPAPATRSSLAAAATPENRDRFVDFIRAASILVVVLGHWTMAALEPGPAGGIRVRNILEVTPSAHPLTWLFQVMPLFFFAAGFTNALALRRSGVRAGSVIAGRVTRVLAPTAVFVAVWLVLAWALAAAGIAPALVDSAAAASAMPLWFLAVYLLLALVAPAQHAVHHRAPWLLVAALPLVALALDRLQGTGWAALGFLNYVVVFGFCQELGFLYADGAVTRANRRVWALAVGGSIGMLWLLTVPGPYPVSMIGLPNQPVSNMFPPSVCVVVVAVLQFSLLMLARPALLRWLRRPGPWRATIVVNTLVMTLFLWHITGLVLAAGTAHLAGVPLPEIGSLQWWLQKPVWLLAATAVTALLVLAFHPVERRVLASGRRPLPPAVAVLVALLSVAGLTMVACAGFAEPFTRGGVAIAGMTFSPAAGAALLGAALVLAQWPTRRGHRH